MNRNLTASVWLAVLIGCGGDGVSTLPPPPVPAPAPDPGALFERALVDRPDEVSGWQLHPVYAIAQDGRDHELDVNGHIERLLQEALDLVFEQTGRRLRVDTYDGGTMDVTFIRLPVSEAERDCDGGPCIGDYDIDSDYPENKIWVVFFGHDIWVGNGASGWWYGGGWADSIGGPDWLGGSVTLPTFHPEPSVSPELIAHEIFHILGAVPGCAPNVASGIHVCDGPDIMNDLSCDRDGWDEWIPYIDTDRDDYYGHDIPDCWDTEDSPLWIDPPQGALATWTRASLPVPSGAPFRCLTR